MQDIEIQHVEQSVDLTEGKNIPDLFRKFFQTAPMAQVIVGPGGALLPNQACRQLLEEAIGPRQTQWQRWLAGAMTRLAASGCRGSVVRPPVADFGELLLEMGPEVDPSGLRVLVLIPMVGRESRTESLAETVSTLYHELRTPLTSMKSSLQLVLRGETGELNDDQRRFLEMTDRNVGRLDRLVGDLLDTSRAAAGSLNLQPEQGDLMPLLEETVEMHQEQALKAGIRLGWDQGPTALDVNVDRDKVVQMLGNVLGNALRFTPAGGEVHLRVLEPDADEDKFTIEVTDTGPGMDEDACQRALEPFQRVHNETECRVPGAGLGLHITLGLARAHGGNLVLESQPGSGTTVRIVLPVHLNSPVPEFSV